MQKGEAVTPHLTRIQNVQYELAVVGEKPIKVNLCE